MKERVGFIFCLLTLGTLSCSGRFVIKTELIELKKEFNGIYVITKPVDIGNNRKAQVGRKVKLYFVSDSESIKVYAYQAVKPREAALGDNILYLFEDDFPDEQWNKKLFKEKLNQIIRPSR